MAPAGSAHWDFHGSVFLTGEHDDEADEARKERENRRPGGEVMEFFFRFLSVGGGATHPTLFSGKGTSSRQPDPFSIESDVGRGFPTLPVHVEKLVAVSTFLCRGLDGFCTEGT